MKILITRGAEFVGSVLVRFIILTADWTTGNVDKLTHAGRVDSLAEAPSLRHTHYRVRHFRDGAAIGAIFKAFQPARRTPAVLR